MFKIDYKLVGLGGFKESQVCFHRPVMVRVGRLWRADAVVRGTMAREREVAVSAHALRYAVCAPLPDRQVRLVDLVHRVDLVQYGRCCPRPFRGPVGDVACPVAPTVRRVPFSVLHAFLPQRAHYVVPDCGCG